MSCRVNAWLGLDGMNGAGHACYVKELFCDIIIISYIPKMSSYSHPDHPHSQASSKRQKDPFLIRAAKFEVRRLGKVLNVYRLTPTTLFRE